MKNLDKLTEELAKVGITKSRDRCFLDWTKFMEKLYEISEKTDLEVHHGRSRISRSGVKTRVSIAGAPAAFTSIHWFESETALETHEEIRAKYARGGPLDG